MDTLETQTAENAWAHLEQQSYEVDEKNPLINSAELVSENTPENQPDEDEIESGALMALAIKSTADIFAPNWNITESESGQLGEVYGQLLDKYLPENGLNKYGLELSAVMITAMILKSRSGTPLKKVIEKPKSKKDSYDSFEDKGQEIKNENTSGILTPKAVENV